MPYSGLTDFVTKLEDIDELHRIKTYVDPVLEIAEITDRVTKNNGKALLFDNNGTRFPLLINTFGSDRRMAMALGKEKLSEASDYIAGMVEKITGDHHGLIAKLKVLPELLRMTRFFPARSKRRGKCQQVIIREPDLAILPVLKCWPHDGGRFITLPMVHTVHPLTGKTNLGMYRMQVFGRTTTGMHWQRHKTGAAHYQEWKKLGKKMPVTVTLGGDPVYTYCATAPLPENISEYILAGFLRRKRVRLVRCITNDLHVPDDADIVIEGYVDPLEDPVIEGPFGDHTGFYSLEDLFPVFHVTCITHSEKAIYPATIVGVPPMEDAWFARATELIFLAPLKLAIQSEVIDMHLPDAGVAHNLLVVKIKKTYPGQGLKVISSLSGAGQMMFSKYIIVVSGDVDIRNYRELAIHVIGHATLQSDVVFSRGPLDDLDHSSGIPSFGGKAGIDATIKLPEERDGNSAADKQGIREYRCSLFDNPDLFTSINDDLCKQGIGIVIAGVDISKKPDQVKLIRELLEKENPEFLPELIIVVDHTVDVRDYLMTAWQVLGNTDPQRDHVMVTRRSILLDATIKFGRHGKFKGRWPNVVCSDRVTIEKVDSMWDELRLGTILPSPSLKTGKLMVDGKAEIELLTDE